jgi:hypothetical protein
MVGNLRHRARKMLPPDKAIVTLFQLRRHSTEVEMAPLFFGEMPVRAQSETSRETLESLFDRIGRKLQNLGAHVFNPALLHCALCGNRMTAMSEEFIPEETDGVPLCQSCFGRMLKEAAQTPEYRNLAQDTLDEHLA